MSAWEQNMDKKVEHLEAKIEALSEKLGKTEVVEEIYNKVIDGSLFSQIPVIKEMKDEMFKYKMNLKSFNKYYKYNKYK